MLASSALPLLRVEFGLLRIDSESSGAEFKGFGSSALKLKQSPSFKSSFGFKRSGFSVARAESVREGVGPCREPQVQIRSSEGSNTRVISAEIKFESNAQEIWRVLTDYEKLGEFIPSLALNQLLERRPNGALLLQVGQQDIALGFKFKARAVVEVEELQSESTGEGIQKRIRFEMVEGDFKVFKGFWVMKEEVSTAHRKQITSLSYTVEVKPQIWMPVAIVEGRLASDICSNLTSIQAEVVRRRRVPLSL